MGDDTELQIQAPLAVSDDSEPEPDVTVLRFKENYYSDTQANAGDTHLIVEVAVFTLQTDRTIKKKKYAAAGVPEYWIVIPRKRTVEVYRKPEHGTYQEKKT